MAEATNIKQTKPWITVSAPLGVQIRVGRPAEVIGNGITVLLSEVTEDSKTNRGEFVLDDESRKALILALQAWDG